MKEKIKVTEELIKNVAEIARLRLTEHEIKEFTKDCEKIIEYFSKIQEVDTSTIQEVFHPLDVKNALREDIIGDSLSQDEATKNAIHVTHDYYFKGPKAIEK